MYINYDININNEDPVGLSIIRVNCKPTSLPYTTI